MQAFIGDATHGIRSLKDVLVDDFGLELDGWTLEASTSISQDGSVIAEHGTNPLGRTEGWVAVIPEPSGVVLAVSGLLGLLAFTLRRRKRAA